MQGENAFELIKEYSRSTDILPAFNDDKIRTVLKEIDATYMLNHEDAKTYQRTRDQSLLPIVNYRHLLMSRNKRCILAYLYNRLERIKSMRWEIGPIVPASLKTNMCAPEIMWFNKYSEVLSNYMASLSDDIALDITQHTRPPTSLYVEVRCLVDEGKFELDSGDTISMKKDTIHYIPRAQAEPLIRKGILEEMKN